MRIKPGQSQFCNPGTHIGEVLLGKGRPVLEQQIGYQPDKKTTIKRWMARHANGVYLSGVLLLTLLILLSLLSCNSPDATNTANSLLPSSSPGASHRHRKCTAGQWVVILLISFAVLIPALTVATSLVNWLITLVDQPVTFCPNWTFKEGIPGQFKTLVVIPAMITNHKEIESLAHQLEQHYLGNPEPGITFALLTDFKDADSETLPEDEDLLVVATAAIEELNRKYGSISSSEDADQEPGWRTFEGASLFYFLHRKRLWNPSERTWMGWERKRGKLHELNLLLRGQHGPFVRDISPMASLGESASNRVLQQIRFVITLDTDTILPRGAACRLAGTLAHPLNQAVFDEKTGQVISGYTVLQPRMEIHPKSTNHSWFTRFFAGDAGLDLYTLAVSDSYQDLFQEGIYVGKGIYDVDAFMRSVDKHIPENTVLSHDLLEGLMGRAGLVTDITMIEDYPQNYIIQALRQRRWIRGDWQLLPWLFQPGKFGVTFTVIDRWKMFDNLRRALLAPALVLIFFLGMVLLPGLASLWTAIVLLALGIPLLTGLARSAVQILGGEVLKDCLAPIGLEHYTLAAGSRFPAL